MTEHRYPSRVIMADYCRAAAGIILTLGPLIFVPVATIAGTAFLVLAILFIAFAVRTWDRQRLIVSLDDSGVTTRGLLRKNIAWRDIVSLELRYYAVKRDRSQGWMQLTLGSADRKIKMESTLEAFETIVRDATRVAHRNGVTLSPSTRENIKALGLPTDELRDGQDAPAGNA